MLSARYLNRLPVELVDLFGQLEDEIMRDIARRINSTNYNLTDTIEWQSYKLKQLGYTQKEINKTLAKYLNKSNRMIEKIMLEATRYGYDNDSIVYRRAKKQNVDIGTLVEFEDAPHLQQLLDAGIKQTQWEMRNFTRTLGQTISNQYIQALDIAWLKVQSGAFTTRQAVKDAVIRLSREGVRVVDYTSGHTDRLDVAVRRAVVTGCNKTNAEISLKRMQDMNTDLVITTSHAGARLEHEAWQGEVFSYSGMSTNYKDFRSVTGYGTVTGLCGVNCRHSFYPYIEGVSTSTMQDVDKSTSDKVYKDEQRQRYIERQIRAWKRREKLLSEIGEDTTRERAKIREWQLIQRKHLKETGLQRQYDREQVY